MPVLAIIQARLGSQRFPRKALADLGGRPLIARVVERVRQVRGIDDVVLAVPAGQVGELAYCSHVYGPDADENDVMTRFVMAAAQYPQHQTIMRVTGDCPLFSPFEAERVLALFHAIPGCHYAWNVAPGYVDGEDCEVFSREALLEAHWHATDPADREHVTPYIRRHHQVCTVMPLDKRDLKTSVDTPEDLERVRAMYGAALRLADCAHRP